MRDIIFQKSVRLTKIFAMNIVAGLGWALGVTLGFAFLVTLVTALVTTAGGLPVVGSIFQDVSNTIQDNILIRK